MRLSYRQQRQLRLVDAAVRQSDPHLTAMFGIFGRLYRGQDLPGAEQLPDQPASRGRLRPGAAWLVAALTTAAVAISVLLGKAVTAAASWFRAPAPAPAREPARPRVAEQPPDRLLSPGGLRTAGPAPVRRASRPAPAPRRMRAASA